MTRQKLLPEPESLRVNMETGTVSVSLMRAIRHNFRQLQMLEASIALDQQSLKAITGRLELEQQIVKELIANLSIILGALNGPSWGGQDRSVH